jgi:ABC-2 type transport system ATP-binding protein
MSRASAEYTISLDHVTRRFGGRPAVDDLSLRVRRGTTLGFIGLNGAGKTTAIRLMVGLLAPDAGRIEIDGIPHERDRVAVKARIGYVPDRPNVYPWMRVGEAIAFARSFHPRWNEGRCRELLRMFRLDPTRRAGQLSKGQAAKLSLLLAISHDPPVLILDEPTNGLDPVVRDEFLEGVLATAGEQDQTVLFSSHALGEVRRLADSVAFLHEGRLLLHGDIEDLLDRTKRVRAVREDESENVLPPPGTVFQQVNGREWLMTLENFDRTHVEFVRAKNRVSHVAVQDMSLDDLFKDFVRGRCGGLQAAQEVS